MGPPAAAIRAMGDKRSFTLGPMHTPPHLGDLVFCVIIGVSVLGCECFWN